MLYCLCRITLVSVVKSNLTSVTSFEPRIIHGTVAKTGQFPWQVSMNIVTVTNETYFCGGALVSSTAVLTAAHCALGAQYFLIWTGTLSSVIRKGYFLSRNYVVHENYSTLTLNSDIALITTSKISFKDTVQSIPLGTGYVGVGSTLRVSGWGASSDTNKAITSQLYYADLLTIGNNLCSLFYRSLSASQLCCIGIPNESTCHGDSGGPLIQQTSNGGWVHVGIVSFTAKAGCTLGYPTGFTRTASYLDWIKKHMY
ncbi:hypothetical protein RI129_004966 [Pyrocoelia pectoralis]|uniref:Peptidase S1 domain-containing protein n=1 Tax=Pyrocoelia pectoralis TaxID=417401 RepID=A0AAN7ZJW0_9COLE